MPFNTTKNKQLKVELNGTEVGAEQRLNLIEGAGIDLTGTLVTGNTIDLTFASTITQYTDELAQDAFSVLFSDTPTINFTYNDAGNAATFDVIQSALDHTQFLNKGTYTHSQIDSHIDSVSNPHSLTKSQIGLGNVENTTLSNWNGSTSLTTLGTVSTGTIPTSLLSGQVLVGNGGTQVNGSAASNGQLLVGNGSGFTLAQIQGALGFSVTNGSGTVTIDAFRIGPSAYYDDDGGLPTVNAATTATTHGISIGDGAASTSNYSFAIGTNATDNTIQSIITSGGRTTKVYPFLPTANTVVLGSSIADNGFTATLNQNGIVLGSLNAEAANTTMGSSGASPSRCITIGTNVSATSQDSKGSIVIGSDSSANYIGALIIGASTSPVNGASNAYPLCIGTQAASISGINIGYNAGLYSPTVAGATSINTVCIGQGAGSQESFDITFTNSTSTSSSSLTTLYSEEDVSGTTYYGAKHFHRVTMVTGSGVGFNTNAVSYQLPADSLFAYRGRVTGGSGSVGGGTYFEVNGLINTSAGLVASNTTELFSTVGFSPTVTTTNPATDTLKIQVSANSTPRTWKIDLEIIELKVV